MTTEQIDPGDERETLSQRASRRLRGALAENRIPQTALARALHLPQQNVSRRLTGFTPFTVDELEHVALILRVPVDAILGVGEYADKGMPTCSLSDPETRAAPGGGTMFLPGRGLRRSLCANRDLNPEPADSEPPVTLTALAGGRAATVVMLEQWRSETSDLVESPRPVLAIVRDGAA